MPWVPLIMSAGGSVAGLIAMLAVAGSLVSAGAYLDHRHEEAKFAKVMTKAAELHTQAVVAAMVRQKEMDDAALSAATAETDRQSRMAATTQAQLAYLRAHPVSIPCVPWGFVRVLNAAITGTGVASVHIPARAADAACASVDANTLARTLVANFGNANANAEQLTGLQDWARQIAKVK